MRNTILHLFAWMVGMAVALIGAAAAPAFAQDSVVISNVARIEWQAQGQTLSKVGVFLGQDVFGHGQLYVAASRVSHPDNIRFALKRFPESCATRNIVYTEVLL